MVRAARSGELGSNETIDVSPPRKNPAGTAASQLVIGAPESLAVGKKSDGEASRIALMPISRILSPLANAADGPEVSDGSRSVSGRLGLSYTTVWTCSPVRRAPMKLPDSSRVRIGIAGLRTSCTVMIVPAPSPLGEQS